MSLSIPYTFIGGPGNKAKASQVNANFQACAGKFTEGSGGIGNEDIRTNAGIVGTKLSSIPGLRIPNDRFDDDTVDARVLRDDAAVDGNRSVTTNHLRDGCVTPAKLAAAAIVSGKLKLNIFDYPLGSVSPALSFNQGITGLTATTGIPLFIEYRRSGATNNFDGALTVRFYLRTDTGQYYFQYWNEGLHDYSGLTIRVYWLSIA